MARSESHVPSEVDLDVDAAECAERFDARHVSPGLSAASVRDARAVGDMTHLCHEHIVDEDAGRADPATADDSGAGIELDDPKKLTDSKQRSGVLHRPIHEVKRRAVVEGDAITELEKYKLSLRKYAPVQKGVKGLPWAGQFHCVKCDGTVPGRFLYEAAEDKMFLEFDCGSCGQYREHYHDVLFVKNRPGYDDPKQPRKTHKGFVIRPIVRNLPKTVETLCPECGCNILGRYYLKGDEVLIDKTCPEHGYFRDKISSDAYLYLKSTRSAFQDEQGVFEPQVEKAYSCPSDCGLCNQHISASCLAQLDLTNRCNLTCPVCFANSNTAGYVSEPTYEMIVEMLQALRNQHPYPATAIQFTGGEPTIHPDFHKVVRKSNEMGFSHVQIATNGITHANLEFAERSAEAGLHTLYLQFDGLDDHVYKKVRAEPLLEKKLQCIENCRKTGMKICLVPTIIKNFNDHQVPVIFNFAVQNADVISAISYQPVVFTGRINRRELAKKRYTLGDLAHDLARCSGADPHRDFTPLSFITPLSRILQTLDGKPKIRPSCHSDCAFGTYFFITPEREAIPIPKLFDVARLFGGMNELHARIARTREHGRANWVDKLALLWNFFKSYRWSEFDKRINPFTFITALQGLTDKHVGRGDGGKKPYRTLMAAGMHFMDRYNYDIERVRRCIIQYSTPDGVYPFCTINSGPTYRPYIEKMYSQANPEWQRDNPHMALRPSSHPNAVMPWAGRHGIQDDEAEEWVGSTAGDRQGVAADQERRAGIKLKIAGQSAPLPQGARILGGSGGCGGGGGCGCG